MKLSNHIRGADPYLVITGLDLTQVNCSCCQGYSAMRAVRPIREEYREQYPYYRGPACYECTKMNERTFVQTIPEDDLPLWMSHVWLWNLNAAAYNVRLDAYLGVARKALKT